MDLRAELRSDICSGVSGAGVGDDHLVSDATDGLEGPGKVLLFVPRNQTDAQPYQEATVYATSFCERGLLLPRLPPRKRLKLALELERRYRRLRSWARPTP
jgi:hypothetical protein